MDHIVIAGGSGFLGTSLAEHLTRTGVRVTILSRSSATHKTDQNRACVPWDGRSLGDWVECLDGCSGLVNLAGRTVDCIKTPDHQDEILRSRVESTLVLGQAMRQVRNPPPTWVQMSTAHIYGDPEILCDESSPHGYGFAPYVGKAWEDAHQAALLPAQRSVILRTSFVIGRDRGAGGGALQRLAGLTRLGLGGTVASGKQGMSWIHEDDMNSLFERSLFNTDCQGIYIASSPNPLSQREFMQALRHATGIKVGLPATEWMVRFGASILLRTDPELALYGRYVHSKRLAQEGFEFAFPKLEPALANLLK